MSRPVVVVTRRLPDAVEARVSTLFDVRYNVDDEPSTASDLRAALGDSDGILTTVTDRFDAEVLSAAPFRTRILANFGVGHEHIDLDAARAAGIVVTNTPGVLTDDTADLAIALMLAVARRIGEGERLVRSGRWSGWRPTQMLGTRITGATLGVVGMGRIGQAVARRAHLGFGMAIRYLGTRDIDLPFPTTRCGSLRALLTTSDVVSLHVPSTPATRHMIDADAFATMRPGAILINTARGDIVDTPALIAALRSGRIAAGLDVYEGEPAIPPELCALDNVVLLPHLGSATVATREAMGHCAVDNLVAFFSGADCPNRVA